jgi:hypothetical protein
MGGVYARLNRRAFLRGLTTLWRPSGLAAFPGPYKTHPKSRCWVLASGMAALIAGLLIASQLPSSATWVIGFLVGIKMMMAGWSFIASAANDTTQRACGQHRQVIETRFQVQRVAARRGLTAQGAATFALGPNAAS